jgi:hypothetical protein
MLKAGRSRVVFDHILEARNLFPKELVYIPQAEANMFLHVFILGGGGVCF